VPAVTAVQRRNMTAPSGVTHGSQIAANLALVGPRYSSLQTVGGYQVSTPGATIERQTINGDLVIAAAGKQWWENGARITGVTVRDCTINGRIRIGQVFSSQGTPNVTPAEVLIEHCEIVNTDSNNEAAVMNSGYTMRRCKLWQGKRGPVADNFVVIEECAVFDSWGTWVQSNTSLQDHRSIIGSSSQGIGHRNVRIRRNYLDARTKANPPITHAGSEPWKGMSAVLVAYDHGGTNPVADYLLEDNLLVQGESGWFAYLTSSGNVSGSGVDIKVRGNIFARGGPANGEGLISASQGGRPWAGSEWTQNRWGFGTQPTYPSSTYMEGSLVSAPYAVITGD
jgi:hypothetical protein